MKAAPTLDGRLRIDLESALDVVVLKSLVADAAADGDRLASWVAGGMPEEVDSDWREFVIPDLCGHFHGQVATVAGAVRDLSPGSSVFIGREDAVTWYGVLNQARLALEEKHHFKTASAVPPSSERIAATVRVNFYQVIQQMLLEFMMP